MIARPENIRSFRLSTLAQYDLFVIDVPGDGSCLFHCILGAYTSTYFKIPTHERIAMVKEYRESLADVLPDYYNKLGKGNIKEIAKVMSEYSLESLQSRIRDSREYVDNIFNEYISNVYDIDIYILSEQTGDVYPMGADMSLLYKDRESIVILYTSLSGPETSKETGHYQLVSHKRSNGEYSKLFPSNYPLIIDLKNRLKQLSK